MAKGNTIIVEIDGNLNQSCYWRPLQKRIRGRFDLHRVKEPNAGKLHSIWPEPIPGQQLSLDLVTAEGAILEPLYEAKFAAIREKIEQQGQKLPAEREIFQGVDVATWVFFLRELVDSGKARLIEGEFPKIDESKVQRRFHSSERPGTEDKLLSAIEQQNALLTQLLSRLTKQE
jgi:hypothetical protein